MAGAVADSTDADAFTLVLFFLFLVHPPAEDIRRGNSGPRARGPERWAGIPMQRATRMSESIWDSGDGLVMLVVEGGDSHPPTMANPTCPSLAGFPRMFQVVRRDRQIQKVHDP